MDELNYKSKDPEPRVQVQVQPYGRGAPAQVTSTWSGSTCIAYPAVRLTGSSLTSRLFSNVLKKYRCHQSSRYVITLIGAPLVPCRRPRYKYNNNFIFWEGVGLTTGMKNTIYF